MFASLGTIPGDIGEEEKKRRTSNFLIDKIITCEEITWEHCKETPACKRSEFICNSHRVAAVHARELPHMQFESTCFTVGNLVRGEAAQKWIRSVLIWGKEI